ncbi:unnamed protein product [Mytilus coruscus]|uniref:Uncharacterized protein n=1 Tax=Mytilus coruscus TaxID=42192 RepID=A0A6J8AYS8_MYTCO|nr:unnamed protein product [Mytilus coruscus]
MSLLTGYHLHHYVQTNRDFPFLILTADSTVHTSSKICVKYQQKKQWPAWLSAGSLFRCISVFLWSNHRIFATNAIVLSEKAAVVNQKKTTTKESRATQEQRFLFQLTLAAKLGRPCGDHGDETAAARALATIHQNGYCNIIVTVIELSEAKEVRRGYIRAVEKKNNFAPTIEELTNEDRPALEDPIPTLKKRKFILKKRLVIELLDDEAVESEVGGTVIKAFGYGEMRGRLIKGRPITDAPPYSHRRKLPTMPEVTPDQEVILLTPEKDTFNFGVGSGRTLAKEQKEILDQMLINVTPADVNV